MKHCYSVFTKRRGINFTRYCELSEQSEYLIVNSTLNGLIVEIALEKTAINDGSDQLVRTALLEIWDSGRNETAFFKPVTLPNVESRQLNTLFR